ncbi:MAG TPA: maltotransferase domain-containing protein, partial [Actinomycetes bacterium]|nr:maltotransferase domain-containing protein [Actinomycetes bacterium]
MIGRIVIEGIRPQVDCGRWPARAVVGETLPVRATVFRDGHTVEVAAAVRLLAPGERQSPGAPGA